MWVAPLVSDSRKNCFLTTQKKLDLTSIPLPVIKIHQSSNPKIDPVYVTCAGKSGHLNSDETIIGSLFAKANNLTIGAETVFQMLSHHIPNLTSVIAEPSSKEDWELLELNAELVQEDLMNRIRVVWIGAVVPIWLSEFVNLTIRIVSVEPNCAVGMLMNDTEIHVAPPKVQPSEGEISLKKTLTFSSIFSQILHNYKPNCENVSEERKPKLNLRALPIEDPEKFLSLAAEINPGIVKQPYMAYISNVYHHLSEKIQNCIGVIENEHVKSYCSINLIQSKDFPVFQDAIYLTDCLMKQLRLQVKQKVKVIISVNDLMVQCDKVCFYTFLRDRNVKELERETKAWLKSLAKNDSNLVLNHGQHIEVPSMLEKKMNSFYVGLHYEDHSPSYCCVDEVLANRLAQSLKVIQVNCDTAPKYLLFPENDELPQRENVEKIGGMNALLTHMTNVLLAILGLTENQTRNTFNGCNFGNILISGPRGSGKTSLVKFLCNVLESHPYFVYVHFIDCSALKGKKAETLQRDWRGVFEQLQAKEPSILVLDDIDLLASNPQTESDDMLSGESWYYARIAGILRDLLKEIPSQNKIVVIATVASAKALHPMLCNSDSTHLFTYEFVIPPLTKEAKLDIVKTSILNRKMVLDNSSELSSISSKMDGFVASDIARLVEKAGHIALAKQEISNGEILLGVHHLEHALLGFVPHGLHGLDLKPPLDSRIAWNDVGGLTNAKKILIETLKWPTQYPEFFANCPIRLRSAVLLYGAPGTGKTMLARAVATECDVNFISIKGPELLSKYIGASEESVRETFRRARSAKPCMLFFDEFESLAPRRGHDSTGVTDRVVNQLLTELDGVEGQEAGVWILGATSRPDLIDPALLRPGRFDVSVQCPLPDEVDRLEILKALSSNLKLEQDVNLEEIARQAEHFSGADIQAVLYTAQIKAINERMESHAENTIRISHRLLMNALRETRPSVSASERQRYNHIYENFDSGRSGITDVGIPRVTLA